MRRFVGRAARVAFAVGVVASLVIALGSNAGATAHGLWGIELPIARSVADAILKILLTVVLGYVIWELVNAFVERKLKTIQTGPEGGGAGGNRFRTLQQLSRKFILVVW